jgi:hypothetical protein
MYRCWMICLSLLPLLRHLPRRATATGLALFDGDTMTPEEEDDDDDDDDDDESLILNNSDVSVVIEMELVVTVADGVVVVVVDARIASKNASRTKTLGRLFADLYTATHTSSSLSPLSFTILSRREASNWRTASRLAGHVARNLSKIGDADDDDDANDALPLLLLAENELHEKADRRMKSDTETTVGGRRIAVIVIVVIVLTLLAFVHAARCSVLGARCSVLGGHKPKMCHRRMLRRIQYSLARHTLGTPPGRPYQSIPTTHHHDGHIWSILCPLS